MFPSNMNNLIERIMDFDGEFEYHMKITMKFIMKCKEWDSIDVPYNLYMHCLNQMAMLL